VWDAHGQLRYNSLLRLYYRAARVALVVYDITDRASFDHVGPWVNSVLANATGAGNDEPLVMTLGTVRSIRLNLCGAFVLFCFV
jgi:Ras-related protein Rab-11A